MLTSWSLQSTPAELSIASVSTQPAGERILDASALGEPEIAALADHPAPQLTAVHPHAVVGPVTHIGVALGHRLHVRADTTVPEEVDWCTQYRSDQLVWRESRAAVVDAEAGTNLRRELDRLCRSRVHPSSR